MAQTARKLMSQEDWEVLVLVALSRLFHAGCLAPATNKRLRPKCVDQLPKNVTRFVDEQLSTAIKAFFEYRRDNTFAPEIEFLTQVADVLYQFARESGMRSEIKEAAESFGLSRADFYVLLAVLAKNKAQDASPPSLRQRNSRVRWLQAS